MKTPQRLICLALLATAGLLASAASHAETVFERFAPRVLPIPVPVPVPIGGSVRISSGPDYDYDRRPDRRYEYHERYEYRPYPPPPPPPPYWRHHHRHYDGPRYYGPPPRRW